MPDFAKHLAGNGYSFSAEDIIALAALTEKEAGPPREHDTSLHFHIRGEEWDVSCQTAEELEVQGMPNTITRVTFSLYPKDHHVSLELRGDPGFLSGLSLDVSGSDLNWVSGAFERITSSLVAYKTPWGWLHGFLTAVVGGFAFYIGYMLLAAVVFSHILRSEGLVFALAVLAGALAVPTMSAIYQLYPNVEFRTSRARSRRSWRVALWTVILGLVASGIWAAATALTR